MVSTRLQSTTGGDSEGSSRGVRHANSPHVSHDLTPYTAHPSSPHLAQAYVSNTHFLDLPSDCMEKIFSYLGYKQVSQLRLVSKQMDRVCSAILNSTFQKLQTQMLHRFQGIKAKMPRRESARRNHPLACESDIIETLHMRLTLLQMSFGKHIERKHVCFFAGEILDEVYRILHYIKVTPKLARPYKVTDELFDLSTMAMEYFKEHIEPTLPEIAYFGTDFLEFTRVDRPLKFLLLSMHHRNLRMKGKKCNRYECPICASCIEESNAKDVPTSNKYMSLDSPPHGIGKGDESPTTTQSEDRGAPQQSNMVLRKRIRKIKQGMKRYNYQLSQMRKEIRCCRGKVNDHQKTIMEYATRLDDFDKKTEESNRKFSTMLQELNKCKTELQYWRSKSPLSTMCGGCGLVTIPEHSDMEALGNQGMLPELEPAFPGPSTSTLDVWTLAGQSPEQRNKRKSSAAEKPAPSGGPPAKKRNVLKPRTKRI